MAPGVLTSACRCGKRYRKVKTTSGAGGCRSLKLPKLKNAEGSSHMGRDSSAFFISCFLIARSTVSRALLQCTDHSHCFSTSFSFLIKLVKKPGTKVTHLRKLGIPADKAYQWGNSRLGYWRIAGSLDLKCSITNERLAAAGYFSILNYYESLHSCG